MATSKQSTAAVAADVSSGTWQVPRPDQQRGPCPAINALANHGYIPRDGRVTAADLTAALTKRLGLSRSLAVFLVKSAFARLAKPDKSGETIMDIHDLALHSFIEHDASLTRVDAGEGDQAAINQALVDQLLRMSASGTSLTLEDLAAARRLRVSQASADKLVGIKGRVLGVIEAALAFEVLARHNGSGIPLDDAREFFQRERLPEGLPVRAVGWLDLLTTAGRLALLMVKTRFRTVRK
jgi:hypothetical protein